MKTFVSRRIHCGCRSFARKYALLLANPTHQWAYYRECSELAATSANLGIYSVCVLPAMFSRESGELPTSDLAVEGRTQSSLEDVKSLVSQRSALIYQSDNLTYIAIAIAIYRYGN